MPKYVDAEALKAKLRQVYYDDFNRDLLSVIIDDTPAADVAPVMHGRWVRASGMMPPEAFGVYECSLCGWTQDYHIPTRLRQKTPYCPWCGAKLEGNDNADQ